MLHQLLNMLHHRIFINNSNKSVSSVGDSHINFAA